MLSKDAFTRPLPNLLKLELAQSSIHLCITIPTKMLAQHSETACDYYPSVLSDQSLALFPEGAGDFPAWEGASSVPSGVSGFLA
jgi:hypothetical protein